MGEDLMFSMPTVVLLVIFYFTWQIRVTVINFKDAAGLWDADFWKPYVAAVVNLITNIALVQLIGINGVFISTIICMVFINFPWETHVLFKNLFNRSPVDFYVKQGKVVARTVILCVLTYFVCGFVTVKGILGLIIKIAICGVLPNLVIVLMTFKTDEFRYWVSKLFGKK